MSDLVLEEDEQTAIKARHEELNTLKAARIACQEELGALEAELVRFEQRYNETVGVRLSTLDELEARVAELTAALNPEDVGATRYAVEARTKATASAQSLGSVGQNQSDDGIRSKGFPPISEPPRLAQHGAEEETEAQHKDTNNKPPISLKSLWRQIAKYLHPDRAFGREDEELMHELMVEATLAYERGDRENLEELLRDGHLLEAAEPGTLQLLHLTMAIDRTRRQVDQVEAQIAAVKGQYLFLLKQRVDAAQENGTDLLARMERFVDEQIVSTRQRLAQIINRPVEDID